jgi:hypothetical protein
MDNNEKVLQILTNMYKQCNKKNAILRIIINYIKDNGLCDLNIDYVKNVLLELPDTHPNISVSFADMMFVIDYLESIQVMKKLSE